jgi:hypothetical protein
MRIPLVRISILLLASIIVLAPVAPALGEDGGLPAFGSGRVEPLPPVDDPYESSAPAVLSPGAVYGPDSGPDIALASYADSPVTTASYDEGEPPRTRRLSGWTFGYDGGFLIASPAGCKLDTDDSDFLMRIGTWGQLRYAASDYHGPNPDLNQFELERLRLSFKGHAFSRDFQYFFQFDSDTDEGEDSAILDYYITYDVGHHVWGCPRKRLAIRGGKWKSPFTRFRVPSPTHLEFTDFAMAGMVFDLNRGLGVGLLGERYLCARPFTWQVALINGLNVGGFRTNRSFQLDDNLAFAGRVSWLLAGDDGKDGEPDLDFRLCPAWRVGAGIACSHVNREGLREFSRMRVVDSGLPISFVLPAAVTGYDIFMFTLDSHLKYRGLSFITDYYFRSMSGFVGAPVPDVYDHGFLVQLGYFVVPQRFELLTRWSRVVGDSGTLGLVRQTADEVAFGGVWYIRGHNLKMTFDVTHIDGAPIAASTLNMLPGDAGWLFRTQFQWRF